MWNDYYDNYGYGSAQFNISKSMPTDPAASSYHLHTERHLGGSNFLFVDGHVKWLSRKAVESALAASNSAGCAPVAGGFQGQVAFCWS